jgi:hypothetical protein
MESTMQYLMLIYLNEAEWEALSPEEHQRRRKEFDEYSMKTAKSGHLLGGNPLHPVRTATTVRSSKGRLEMIDGPFAETKEQLAGYFLMEVKDLDEALALARECPGSKYATVEVRPCAPKGGGN